MDQLFHPSKHLYWHTLSHKFNSQFKSRHRFHTYKVIGTTVVMFIVAFIMARSIPSAPAKVLGEATTVSVQEQTDVITNPPPITESSVPTSANTKNLVQYVKLTPKTSATMSGLLADELVLALGLPLIVNQPFPIQSLVIDALGATHSAIFNGTYIAVIDSDIQINPTREYESPSAFISIQPAPATLLPYVLNKSFCATSQDCVIRESACIEGAYNRYEPFADNLSCMQHVKLLNNNPTACVFVPTCIANRCQVINNCNQ